MSLDDERRERRARMEALHARRRYADALAAAADDLELRLGLELSADEALTAEAATLAQQHLLERSASPAMWHRVWGRRLRHEMLATVGRLADALEHERAVLLWGFGRPVGFLVPTATVLRRLGPQVGPPLGTASERRCGPDVLLLAEDHTAGLLLAYDHLPTSDEYELRSWGRYARSVA